MNSERPSGPWEPRGYYLGVEYVLFGWDGDGNVEVGFWSFCA